MTTYQFLTQEFTMLKDKLAVVAQVTRKSEPWAIYAATALVVFNHVSKKNK